MKNENENFKKNLPSKTETERESYMIFVPSGWIAIPSCKSRVSFVIHSFDIRSVRTDCYF